MADLNTLRSQIVRPEEHEMIKYLLKFWGRKISRFCPLLLIGLIFSGCGPSTLQINNWEKTGAVDPLIATLKDQEWHARGKAADALGKLKDNRAIEPLLKVALNDNDAHVRKRAALALGNIGNADAVNALNVLMRQAAQSFCKERTELYYMLSNRFPKGNIKAPEKCQAKHDCIICGKPAVDFCLINQGWVCEKHICETAY